MIWVYRLLFLPLMSVVAPYYLWRMRKRGGYSRHFGDRFGALERIPAKSPQAKRVWIQAVSVGEMLAIGPLLDRLASQPGCEVVLTTTTSTGFALAQERYARKVVGVGYFPLDAWPFSRRAWNALQPDVAVLTEGERWPEHIAQASARGCPVVCINARLSDRSFRRMLWVRGLTQPLLGGIRRILAVSPDDAHRFEQVGFPPDTITVTGNLKLDVPITPVGAEVLARLRGELGFPPDHLVVLGSSTWPGEEEVLVSCFLELRRRGLAVCLLLVPRHAERRGEIVPLLEQSQRPFHVRSRGPATGPVEICLADTTGELRRLTQVADVVFVGKSLSPHTEGQTPVEAAALGRPLLFGPGMSNFRPISRELIEVRAARVVEDKAGLQNALEHLLTKIASRHQAGEAGAAWHRRNQGALDRTWAELRPYVTR